MAIVSRQKLNHPALGTLGGSSLHASIESLWEQVGDSTNDRFFTSENLANAASVDFDHNFYVDFSELSYQVYEWDPVTGELLGKLNNGVKVEPKTGDLKRQVTVTNNTGAEKDIAVVLSMSPSTGTDAGGQTLLDNQAAAVNITDLIFDKDNDKSAVFYVDVHRRDDTQHANEMFECVAMYDPEDDDWELLVTTIGDDSGVVLSIDATTSQVKYTSSNYGGASYSGKLRFSVSKKIPIAL